MKSLDDADLGEKGWALILKYGNPIFLSLGTLFLVYCSSQNSGKSSSQNSRRSQADGTNQPYQTFFSTNTMFTTDPSEGFETVIQTSTENTGSNASGVPNCGGSPSSGQIYAQAYEAPVALLYGFSSPSQQLGDSALAPINNALFLDYQTPAHPFIINQQSVGSVGQTNSDPMTAYLPLASSGVPISSGISFQSASESIAAMLRLRDQTLLAVWIDSQSTNLMVSKQNSTADFTMWGSPISLATQVQTVYLDLDAQCNLQVVYTKADGNNYQRLLNASSTTTWNNNSTWSAEATSSTDISSVQSSYQNYQAAGGIGTTDLQALSATAPAPASGSGGGSPSPPGGGGGILNSLSGAASSIF